MVCVCYISYTVYDVRLMVYVFLSFTIRMNPLYRYDDELLRCLPLLEVYGGGERDARCGAMQTPSVIDRSRFSSCEAVCAFGHPKRCSEYLSDI